MAAPSALPRRVASGSSISIHNKAMVLCGKLINVVVGLHNTKTHVAKAECIPRNEYGESAAREPLSI